MVENVRATWIFNAGPNDDGLTIPNPRPAGSLHAWNLALNAYLVSLESSQAVAIHSHLSIYEFNKAPQNLKL
jgi:hypothetical protein